MYTIRSRHYTGLKTEDDKKIPIYTVEIDCTAFSDLPQPKNNWSMGSIAHVISTGDFYELDNSGKWVLQTDDNSSEDKPDSSDWVELTNAQITAADYIRKIADGKWLVRVKIVANDVTDLPTAEDFPDWHLSAGSICYILYVANKCFVMDCNGTWIEQNSDAAVSF